MNQFPRDFPHTLTGFGGDPSLNQAQHREACRKCPVILMHGNGGNSVHPKYGMVIMKGFLKEAGYQDCELWCCDYLGENNEAAPIPGVHRDHIDAVRGFIDDVRAYLGVARVDFIGHSLGCGMVNGYLRGLQPDGQWNSADHRLHAAGTFVSLAGAQYGLGQFSSDEFRTGGEFETLSHQFRDVSSDDTPSGSSDSSAQIAPIDAWKVATSLDDDLVNYVAVIARGDFVDQQHRDTSRRHGAHLNLVRDLGAGLGGHEKVIKSQAVFDAFKGYLNRYPPIPPVTFTVDRNSGNYGTNLQVTVTVSPPGATVAYTARRVTKAVTAGYLAESVAETLEGALPHNGTLTLAHDGAWDVRFSSGTGDALERAYGVNAAIPNLTIVTPENPPFQVSLEVVTSTDKGTVYYSTDKVGWLAQSTVFIRETATLHFIAIDADGLASPIVSRSFLKKPVEFVKATLTEHFLAHRLDVGEYVDLTVELGGNAVITLYFIDNDWVRDPDTPEVAPEPPGITLSDDSGVKTGPFTLTVAAHHATDAAPAIHYTLDGSTPTRRSRGFTSPGRIVFDTAGTKTLKCRARDAAGNWSDTVTRTYRLEFGHQPPAIRCDRPGGVYGRAFHTVISGPDEHAIVYYTEDGSDPADGRNPGRKSFEGSKRFHIRGNGPHAILCHAKDGAGGETAGAFGWRIDDHRYPETRIAPSAGGSFVDGVRIELEAAGPCAWTRYTLDGSEPSDTNGETYTAPILLDRCARLRFRSMGPAGQLEPVRSADFIVTRHPDQLAFDSDPRHTGYLVARRGAGAGAPGHAGEAIFAGTGSLLRIGDDGGGRAEARAFVHFDTSSLPDNAAIGNACLEVTFHGKSGDPWGGGGTVAIDVQRGYFGSSRNLHAGDWDAAATAEGVAQIGGLSPGTCRSDDFSQAGLQAINRAGVTQIRLRLTAPAGAPSGACLLLEGGAQVRLHVTLASPDR
ncbi:chitobiase/beta-hexosaminidase C-terminal domain-containing protein [Pseudoduganella dura]|nr:chitobiase/beta-hexosaminidase C-terminal domain-containing protein [Pseudoduganella dura]GGX81954.1 hypothetical protein GCM10007386_11090 [Pseudoduganella dura]